MLKGWVLTDDICPNRGCNIPLMRSPNGSTPVAHYCANCDGRPNSETTSATHPDSVLPIPAQSSPTISSSSRPSRASTPPTELSSTLSSPTFALPVETAESLRRREQSDTASSEIGKRLLKGWAMLAEECPNVRCYGVPLVRPPKAGGGKDPKMECVICGTIYVSQIDPSGRERLISWNRVAGNAPDPAREEMILPSSSGQSTASAQVESKLIAQDETSQFAIPSLAMLSRTDYVEPSLPLMPRAEMQPYQTNTSVSALEVTAKSLELTLRALSEKLSFLSSGQFPLDPPSIAITADAIGKVTQALAQVKQLHWSESRVNPC